MSESRSVSRDYFVLTGASLLRDTNHIALAEHLLTKWILWIDLLPSIILLDDRSFVQF